MSRSRRQVLLAFGAAALRLRARISGVQIGVCGAVSGFARADALGFDYYEPSISALSVMMDAQFDGFRRLVDSSRIRCYSANNFVRNLKVVGAQANTYELKIYLNKTLDRLKQIGTQVVVWGNSDSRHVPESFSKETAWNQVKSFLKYSGDAAAKRDMTIAIEPLRKQESNIINTGAEGLRLVQEINHPHVKLMLGYYHLRLEKEDPQILAEAADQLIHIHFANPAGRLWPKDASEDPEYGRFFELLKQIPYSRGISIEGKGALETDGPASLAFFKKQLEG